MTAPGEAVAEELRYDDEGRPINPLVGVIYPDDDGHLWKYLGGDAWEEVELADGDATAPPQAPFDVEAMLYATVPGGSSCDPQQVADAIREWFEKNTATPQVGEGEGDCHGLDTPERVRFYEHDFYPLSNFSAFRLLWRGLSFDTSEAAYHFTKFDGTANDHVCREIREADSAHEAFKIAERNKHLRRPDWDDVKLNVMRAILRAKVDQHEYVRRKLLATGDRLLVEDSWRDDYWGWGPNRDGQNWLGRLWMELRDQLKAALAARGGDAR